MNLLPPHRHRVVANPRLPMSSVTRIERSACTAHCYSASATRIFSCSIHSHACHGSITLCRSVPLVGAKKEPRRAPPPHYSRCCFQRNHADVWGASRSWPEYTFSRRAMPLLKQHGPELSLEGRVCSSASPTCRIDALLFFLFFSDNF